MNLTTPIKMTKDIIEYALKQLRIIENDNDGVTFHKIEQPDGRLEIYAEFGCGKNITLSDDEVRYQAIEFLKLEIEWIKH